MATETTAQSEARVLERFPAGGPRGSWPAEEFAAARRLEGIPAQVVMDLATDNFHVVVKAGA
jgi:hypothetical protein